MPGLIYVGDPMCSWCWGFAPQIEELAKEYAVEVVVGGLRPGPAAEPLDERLAGFLRHEWSRIAERTGQPFDATFLDKADGWTYDTEPAAIAVTTARGIAEPETLAYFTGVQRAFYSEGRDVTDPRVLADLGEELGLPREEFAAALGTEQAKRTAWDDFRRARSWGISGFPSVIGRFDPDRLVLLASGWTEAEEIRSRIAIAAG